MDCISTFYYFDNLELPILHDICTKAISIKNTNVLNEIVRLTTLKSSEENERKYLFIRVIKQLSLEKNFWWTNYLWFNEESIVKDFVESDYDQILDSLLNCPQIDYHVEQLLIPITNCNPIKVIYFFEKRVQIQNRKKNVWSNNYDAIPHHFNEIGEILNNRSEEWFPVILTWFKKKQWIYQWEASHLLQKVFPVFEGKLESYFLQILPRKVNREAKIMLHILKQYNGNRSIYGFCKQFIVVFNDEPDLLQELMYVLSATGVVTGEYGLVEAYTHQKKEISKWNKTRDEHIKAFVKNYKDYLNLSISAETKRSDEQVELMKLEFESSSR
jgi:hypothetical protein